MFYLIMYNSKMNPIKIEKSCKPRQLKLVLESWKKSNPKVFTKTYKSLNGFRLPSDIIIQKSAQSMYISSKEYVELLIKKYCKPCELFTKE